VLIVEDEPFFAMDLHTVLELEGATSFALADTHADAMSAAIDRRPAVITSDVHLYEGKGPPAVAAMRALLGSIPFIFITATPQDCGILSPGDSRLNKHLDRAQLRSRFSEFPLCSRPLLVRTNPFAAPPALPPEG
jgi:CheY-like chemotaxis protein